MKKQKARKKRLSKKLLSYSAAAGATLALVGTPNVDGAPVYTGADITLSGSNISVSINFDNNNMIDFYASIFEDNYVRKIFLSPANPGNVLGPYNVLTPYNILNPYNILTPYNILMPLEHGALIGSSLFPSVPTLPLNQGQSPSSLILGMGPPGAHSHSHIGNFLDTRGYVGARFEGGSTHYAWIDIELSNNLEQLTIHGWAYESDPLTPINAGATDAVPEPATLALLAIGAAGIIDWRRRQRRRKIKG